MGIAEEIHRIENAKADLKSAINNLGGNLTDENIDAYGAAVRGLSFTETDPTVPSWAKQASKPTYTASEVGAAASSHTHVSADITDPDTTATDGSANLVTSGAAYTAAYTARQYTRSSNNVNAKMFLVGATSQSTRSSTRSNVNCYIGEDNCLYSNGTKTLTNGGFITNSDNQVTITGVKTWMNIRDYTLTPGTYLLFGYAYYLHPVGASESVTSRYMIQFAVGSSDIPYARCGADTVNGDYLPSSFCAVYTVTTNTTITLQGYVTIANGRISVKSGYLKIG